MVSDSGGLAGCGHLSVNGGSLWRALLMSNNWCKSFREGWQTISDSHGSAGQNVLLITQTTLQNSNENIRTPTLQPRFVFLKPLTYVSS
ncbi:hypothetical protein TNCV_4069411 [Trichonephila clavipes]|nr:hypothetical protein TNCV_4069411 [Trichonephila clavipes]